MRFLVDECLSTQVADRLAAADHDAVHVSAYAMSRAPDDQVLSRARDEQRVVLSPDTDFGTLLAVGGGELPSVVLYRRHTGRRPDQQADVLLTGLPVLEGDLAAGAIAVLGDAGNRIHRLPIERGPERRPDRGSERGPGRGLEPGPDARATPGSSAQPIETLRSRSARARARARARAASIGR